MRAKVPIKLIKPSQLTVIFETQREAVSSWVKRLTKRFNWDAVFVLAVWHTPDGRYAIVDGQHRVLAMRALGIDASAQDGERSGPQALACALDVALAAWGTEGDSLHGTVIGGLARLHLDNAWIEAKALSDRLSKSGPPGRLVGTAKSLYSLHKGQSLDACMAKAVGDIYNLRRNESSRVKVPF